MIDVYYGPSISCPFLLTGQPIETLLKNIKRAPPSREILNCPSFVRFCSDVYVLQSPFDIDIVNHNDGYPVARINKDKVISEFTYKDNEKRYAQNLLQMLSQGLWLFFAKESCSINLVPPFLHNSQIYGVAGSYDIGSWFRALSISSIINQPFSIRSGEPLAYVSFNKPVNLKRVIWDFEAEKICDQMVTFKNLEPKNSLSKLYKRSKISGLNKRLLKIAERCVIDED